MKPIEILLVGDNEGDILLTTKVLRENNLKKLPVKRIGRETINSLNSFVKAPDIIFLQVNLPGLNGIGFFKNLPHHFVFRLRMASSAKDMFNCYINHAHSNKSSPGQEDDFSIEDSWKSVFQLPEIC